MANPKGINQYTGKAKAAVAAKVQAVKSGAKAKAAAAVGRRPATSKMPPPKPGTRVTHMPPPKPGTRVTHIPPPKPGTAVNLPAPGAKPAAARPVKSATSSPKATAPAASAPKAPKAATSNPKATTAKQKAAKGPTPGSPVAVKKAQAVLLGQKADAMRVGTDAINAKTTGKKPKPKAWKPKKEDKVVVPASQAPGGKAITITKFIEMKHGTGSPQHLKALATYTTGAKEMNATMRKLYGPPTTAKKR